MYFLKPVLIASCLICVSVMGFAQKKTFSGLVRDSITQQNISKASIRNLNSGTVVISKMDGLFFMDIAVGQLLSVSANGYFTDTIRISQPIWDKALMTVDLRPLPSTLADVVVTGNYTAYQHDSIARRREFLKVVGENKIPTVSRPNSGDFGVAINLDHFDKSERRKREARNLFEITEEEAYINSRWNDSVVAKYTSLQGEPLVDFMQQYRPSYEWLRKHMDDEDVVYYINDRLKRNRRK